ncbi:MAG: sigma-54 dependent transcriptional regulator [Pseudomonadota bacterium]
MERLAVAQPRKAPRVLVIDDDPGLSEVIALLLDREGYAAERARTVKEGVARLAAAEFDLLITDLKLPDGTGLDALARIRTERPELPVILITSYSSMESAIAALRGGAVDYIIKPFDNDEFLHSVRRALAERRIKRENLILRKSLKNAYGGAWPIVGESPGMRRVAELVRKAAPADSNVLILGESGTGKERVALALHYASPRAEGPFVPVDCGSIPREDLEQELFGRARSEGLVREADGGTLFLDEVSEIPPALQFMLLRVLEEKAVRRVHPVDVRVVAATQRDLASLVERGQFRKDLYYRLSVIVIGLPPLRERGEDIPLLARFFAEQYARRLGKRITGFDAEFSAFLANYPWPGNVRELENFIERAVILAESEQLTGRDLAEVAPALPMVRAIAPPLPGGARPLAIEEYIREVVERYQETHTETELARMLGIGRKALWMRRKQWGLKRPRKVDH